MHGEFRLDDWLVPDHHGTMYTVHTMKKKGPEPHSAVLTIRVPRTLDRKLTREARRLRQTRSATARTLLEGALEGTPDGDPVAEARRQSRLASQQASEVDVLEFITTAADLRGWK